MPFRYGLSFLLIIQQNLNNWNMSQEIRKILAGNIEKLRLSKKITKEELSLILGVDNSYISKLEKGKINITIDKIEQLANYFEIEVWKLLKEN